MISPAVNRPLLIARRPNAFTPPMARGRLGAFTLVEMLVVIVVTSILLVGVVAAFNNINGSRGVIRAVNDVSGMLELGRAEAMATRSYVYVGFANTINGDGSAELRIGAVISIDGSSNTASTNLQPISKLVKLPNMLMTNYTNLPQAVKDVTDSSLTTDSDYVIAFPPTAYLKDKFVDSAFDSCPTLGISPQGVALHSSNRLVFFRTTSSVGLAPTHGATPIASDGAIVSYYGGTGQLRVTRPQ
jgi:prepilin-type N-terminal cleavage/methylation domain-containing protein